VSTVWLHLTRTVYEQKLESISRTERDIYNDGDAGDGWYVRDRRALLRGVWFEWRILNACGHDLARAELMVSSRYESRIIAEAEQLRRDNERLQARIRALEAKAVAMRKSFANASD
jgi:hypothetical protein